MSADAAATPEAAPTVGDYRLMHRLGSGAMGEVWLGRHVVTGTHAAVKLLRQGIKSRDRVKKTFDRERRAIGRLGHPNIVALFDVGPEWLATAYVEGTDLARRAKTPLDPAAAVHLTLQIASALAHAHAYGVIHRDVKPSNILLDVDGNAFLADFGLALLPEAIDDDHRVGTVAYMAPEQARGELVGPAADQYALGRTLLELLAGGTLPIDAAAALAELPPELPAALREAIARATAAAPAERFPEVADFGAALAAVDLARYSAPRRLAPEVRVRTPFGWIAGATTTEMLTPDLERVDLRLAALVDGGHFSSEAFDGFTKRTGYRDVGVSIYGNTSRLGRLTNPSAFARATEVVVLVHGMFCGRASWAPVAPSVARDNAQALVISLDHSGFGESRFADATPAPEHAAPTAVVAMVTACLELFGLRDLPTVLVGHSYGAAALLTVRDDELGERISRLAITPVFPAVDGRARRALKMSASLLPALAAVGFMRKLLSRVYASSLREYTAQEKDVMAAEFERAVPAVAAAVSRQYAASKPAAGDQLQRCLVVIADDDPVAPARIVGPALEALGFPRTHVRRLVSAGGHFPHAEQTDHPEWTLRNIADLAGCIGAMLRASSEGTPLPTVVASTLIGSTDV